MKKNINEVGYMGMNELINYRLDLYEDEPNVFSIEIKLDAIDGEIELYVKECI